MDREKTESYIIELENRIHTMNAARNGECIQVQHGRTPPWQETDPIWDWVNNDYRIKPKQPFIWKRSNTILNCDAIELTDEVKEALEKAGIPYAD